jgi:hypothetical protein
LKGVIGVKKSKFRRKPIVVEAYQTDKEVIVETLEGPLRAAPGDWIITGIRGEQYPCKPDVFEETYEPVDDAHYVEHDLVASGTFN